LVQIFPTQLAISFFHFAQSLLLHYLRKEKQAKYALKYTKNAEKTSPTLLTVT